MAITELNTAPSALQTAAANISLLTYKEMMTLARHVHTALAQEWQIVDPTQVSIDDIASAISVAAESVR